MYWSAKKLLRWYYTLRRDDPPPDGSLVDGSDDVDTLPKEPELAIQEVHIRSAKIDPETFDFFYAHYYHRILRFCYRRTRSRDAAEDLTAETFLKALDNIGGYQWSGVSFGAWLYRIAANEIKRLYRDNTRRPESPLPTNILGEDLLVGDEPDPDHRLELTQERELLARYMAQLDLDDQNYLDLRFREEMSTKEIAAIAGVSWGTIASRICRSVQKLQKMADEDEERDRCEK